ncbi:MAG: hypothetical protein SGJ18_13700 [Pseudomonadota bacterium]|nr:hypothetical protein [Pseudomonadota bacterium]
MKALNLISLIILVTQLVACGERDPSISLLPEQIRFIQNSTKLNAKVDILWVMDNSGSMQTSQQNVADNFNVFINDFVTKGYDYRIAVTGTDAYRSLYQNNLSLSKFRDGNGTTHSNVFVIYPNTPNLIPTFMTNILLGTSGSGDERMFQSFHQSLINPLNSGFLRSDSHLAVVMVTDEDDFSRNHSASNNHNYADALMYPVNTYVSFLESFTNSSGANARFTTHAIAIFDDACKTFLNSSGAGRIIAQRVGQLVDATDGVKSSLCDDFAGSLGAISQSILENSSEFFLDREPNVDTIFVRVNSAVVPNSATNGWTYNAASNSIRFHNGAVPAQGAEIVIDFDPATIK